MNKQILALALFSAMAFSAMAATPDAPPVIAASAATAPAADASGSVTAPDNFVENNDGPLVKTSYVMTDPAEYAGE